MVEAADSTVVAGGDDDLESPSPRPNASAIMAARTRPQKAADRQFRLLRTSTLFGSLSLDDMVRVAQC